MTMTMIVMLWKLIKPYLIIFLVGQRCQSRSLQYSFNHLFSDMWRAVHCTRVVCATSIRPLRVQTPPTTKKRWKNHQLLKPHTFWSSVRRFWSQGAAKVQEASRPSTKCTGKQHLQLFKVTHFHFFCMFVRNRSVQNMSYKGWFQNPKDSALLHSYSTCMLEQSG